MVRAQSLLPFEIVFGTIMETQKIAAEIGCQLWLDGIGPTAKETEIEARLVEKAQMWNGKYLIAMFKFDSSSSDNVYETKVWHEGTVSCTCPGWCFGRKCWHTRDKAVLDQVSMVNEAYENMEIPY